MEEHIKYYVDIFHSTLTSNGEVTILRGRQRNGSADGQAGNCIRLDFGVSVLSYDRLQGSREMGCPVFLRTADYVQRERRKKFESLELLT